MKIKQKFLTIFLTLFMGGSINAQVVFNETFSNLNGVFPVGWTRFNVDALTPNTNVNYVNNAWIVRDDLDVPADTVALSTSWYTPAGTSNDWMFTPAITLPAAGNALLTFEGKAYDPSYADGYEVRIMNAAPTAGNIASSTIIYTNTGETDFFTARSVSLSAYAGQTVYIAFRNASTDMFVLAIDDVKVENFITTSPEVSITGVTPGEYTAIPKSQVTSFPVSATVNNSGTGPAASVTLTTSVFKLPNLTTPVYTGTGSIVNLAAGASATINASAAFTPSAPINGEYLFRSVISGNTGSVANDTSYYNVVVNDSVYARDKSTADNAIGVNGSGNTAILGNNFQITANATLSSVLFSTNGIGVGPALGDSTQILVYATTAGVPTGVPIASSALYIYGAADNTSPMVRTIAINGTAGLALTPGTYFVGIKEFFNTNNLGISISNGIFTPNTTYAQVGTGAWTPLENFGFPSAAIIRANFRPVCAVSVTPASQTNVSCFGGSNGAATINTPTGGTGPYTYNWTPGNPTGDGTASVTGLTAGTWTCTVTDANSCTASQSFTVTEQPGLVIPTLTTVTDQCSVSLTAPVTNNACAGTTIGTTTTVFPVTTQGTTVVTWSFDDGNGNIITVPQTVIVDDVTNPATPTLATVTGECSATVIAPTTTDNCAGIITGTTTDPLVYSTQGTFTVNWTFNDGNGNSITVPQTVIVDDVTSPVADVAVLTAITECYEATPIAPTATDNCTGTAVGISDVTFPITAVGSTIVTWTYTDGNGNTSTQTQNVIINTVDNSVTQAVNLLTANAVGSTYQWLDCDNGNAIIIGETNQSYTPAITGNYAVEVTQNGCVDTSACILVDYAGIENLTSTNLSVYPNPSIDGYFNIQFEGSISEVVLFDLLGRTIMVPCNVEQGTLNGSSLAAGKYLIRIYTDKGVFVEQLVIAK